MDVPHRQPRAIELWRALERLLEKRERRGRGIRDQPLDVQLKHLRRRRQPIADRSGRSARAAHLLRQPSENAVEIGHRSARLHLGQQPPGVDAHAAGPRDYLVALHRDRAAGDQRRGDDLPHLDGGGAAEDRVGRQLQPVECLQALLAIDHYLPAANQHFAQQDGGAFAHPPETRVLGGVIERQDDDRRALRGLRADHRRRRERDGDQAREEARQRHATSMLRAAAGRER